MECLFLDDGPHVFDDDVVVSVVASVGMLAVGGQGEGAACRPLFLQQPPHTTTSLILLRINNTGQSIKSLAPTLIIFELHTTQGSYLISQTIHYIIRY